MSSTSNPPHVDRTSATTTRYTISCPSTPKAALADVVARHCRNWPDYDRSKPVADHTLRAFHEILPRLLEATSVVLDSGCGVGRSTQLLAAMHPESLVVGVDRSLARLSRAVPKRNEEGERQMPNGPLHPASAEEEDAAAFVVPLRDSNAVLIRAELVDFWRLLHRHRMAIDHHYLLYPNPYPKLSRLNLRWYGHSAFPLLVANLHRTSLTVRSNWPTYLDEFAYSARMVYAQAESSEDRGTSGADRRLGDATTTGTSGFRHAVGGNNDDDFAATLGRNVHEPTLIQHHPSDPPLTHFEAKYREAGEPCYELRID
jgi:tRNA (guanine-N7-)-methyltransferase